MDEVAGTVAMLRQAGVRVVVLGGVPFWRRGLPSEVLRYYMLRHSLIAGALQGRHWTQLVGCGVARKACAGRGGIHFGA